MDDELSKRSATIRGYRSDVIYKTQVAEERKAVELHEKMLAKAQEKIKRRGKLRAWILRKEAIPCRKYVAPVDLPKTADKLWSRILSRGESGGEYPYHLPPYGTCFL